MNVYKFNATYKNKGTGMNVSMFIKLEATNQFECDKLGLMLTMNHLSNPKDYLLTYFKSEQDEQK